MTRKASVPAPPGRPVAPDPLPVIGEPSDGEQYVCWNRDQEYDAILYASF